MVSSEYPQALRSPQVSADTVKIGSVSLDSAEKDLITIQTNALYLESVSVTFLNAAGTEIDGARLKIYTDITDTSTPTISLTPAEVRDTYRIASLAPFQIKSQSPGSISIEPINPLSMSYLRVTGTRVNATDVCKRIVIWRV